MRCRELMNPATVSDSDADSEVATQVGNLVQMAFSLTTSLTCWQVTDVDIEQAVFLLECLIQEKDDSLKDKSDFRFVYFVRVTHYSTQVRADAGGGGYRHPCIVMPLALLVAVQ